MARECLQVEASLPRRAKLREYGAVYPNSDAEADSWAATNE